MKWYGQMKKNDYLCTKIVTGMRKFFVRCLWAMLIVGIISVAAAFYAISEGRIGYMPPIEDLQNPINRYATQVYSADGKIMGTWYNNRKNRIMIDYTKLSPALVQALVATEDVRFYNHCGIDFYALARAVVKRGILGQKSAGGGSTITQQLAKQLYSATAHSTMERLLQKPIEWVIAVQLERNYTKDEIITMYLNYFDFLHNAVGIKMAANTYYSKEPIDLTTPEAAMLVGLCKNPSLFNPVRNPDRCRDRRNVVLRQMEKSGYISSQQCSEYCAEPLALKFHVVDHKDGLAVYFRDFLRRYMMARKPDRKDYPSWGNVQFYVDSANWDSDPLYGWCNKNLKRDGTPYNIYNDGLKVYTTIDSRMQAYAEQACYEHVVRELQPIFNKENKQKPTAPFTNKLSAAEVKKILMRSVRQSERYQVMKADGATDEEIERAFKTKTKMNVFTYHGDVDTVMTPLDSIRYMKSFLRCGFMSMCPQNGHVKAYVGGLDFMHFAYDMVMDGRRQVGSTIKPFLYSLAMEDGFSPCDPVLNVQRTYIVAGKPWTPRNAGHARYGEMVTLKWGLQQSNNWISAFLLNVLTPERFVEHLLKFGIKNPDIHPSMSLCLGPCDISVGEMVSAYTTFVNHGSHASHMFVTKIEDSEGNLIAQFAPRKKDVINADCANKMLYMLKGVVDGGTAGRLRHRYNMKGDIGGKTGTTNNNSDAWFMGLTPTLVTGCWVGGDDRDIHFDRMEIGQGASMALPIFAVYMKKVYADKQLGYNENARFDLDEGYDPCENVENGIYDNNIEEIFE